MEGHPDKYPSAPPAYNPNIEGATAVETVEHSSSDVECPSPRRERASSDVECPSPRRERASSDVERPSPRSYAERRAIGAKRHEVFCCTTVTMMVLSVLFLVVGGPVSTRYCTPCKYCTNGECAFYRSPDANITTPDHTRCTLSVVFNEALAPLLTRTTLTVEPNCANTFADLPENGAIVPCFTKLQTDSEDKPLRNKRPDFYVGSTTNLDSYAKQCPGMVAGLSTACLLFTLSIVANAASETSQFTPAK
jgi:hypothetical protein